MLRATWLSKFSWWRTVFGTIPEFDAFVSLGVTRMSGVFLSGTAGDFFLLPGFGLFGRFGPFFEPFDWHDKQGCFPHLV